MNYGMLMTGTACTVLNIRWEIKEEKFDCCFRVDENWKLNGFLGIFNNFWLYFRVKRLKTESWLLADFNYQKFQMSVSVCETFPSSSVNT